MGALGILMLRRGTMANPIAGSDYIKFKDEAVFNILMANGVSSDGVGITKDDAAKVTTLGTMFRGNTDITSFDEFRYFTGITGLGVNTTNNTNATFYGCSNLKSIALPESIINIGYQAFYNCTSLESVDCDWTKINALYTSCFDGCTSLYIDNLNGINLTSLRSRALYGVHVKRLHFGKVTGLNDGINGGTSGSYGVKDYLEEIVLPNTGIANLNAYAFEGYIALKIANVPQSLTTLSNSIFKKVPAPLVVDCPNASGFSANSFYQSGVKAVKNLGNISVIGDSAFYQCENLEYAILPNTTTQINADAFNGCTALQYIICHATTPPTIRPRAFNSTNNCPIYVPDESVDAYKTNWADYASQIKPLSEFNG